MHLYYNVIKYTCKKVILSKRKRGNWYEGSKKNGSTRLFLLNLNTSKPKYLTFSKSNVGQPKTFSAFITTPMYYLTNCTYEKKLNSDNILSILANSGLQTKMRTLTCKDNSETSFLKR